MDSVNLTDHLIETIVESYISGEISYAPETKLPQNTTIKLVIYKKKEHKSYENFDAQTLNDLYNLLSSSNVKDLEPNLVTGTYRHENILIWINCALGIVKSDSNRHQF